MLNSIQLLRLVAALSVLLAHIPQWALPTGNPANCARDTPMCGSIGVDLFFCISGFLMAATTANREPGVRTALGFSARRLFRIWPLYALITVAFMFVKNVELVWYWKWLLFVPVVGPNGFGEPPLTPGWTLNYEIYFYGLTALCLLLPWKTRAAAVAVTVLGVASLLIDNAIYFFASIIVEFAFGIAIGGLWMQDKAWNALKRWRLPIIIGSTLLLFFVAHATDWPHPPGRAVPRMDVGLFYANVTLPRFIGWGVPAAFFMLSVMLYEDKISKRASTLGDYTYSIYLLHYPVIFAIEAIGKSLPNGAQAIMASYGGYAALIVAGTLLASFITYHIVERPTQRIGVAIARLIEQQPHRKLESKKARDEAGLTELSQQR